MLNEGAIDQASVRQWTDTLRPIATYGHEGSDPDAVIREPYP